MFERLELLLASPFRLNQLLLTNSGQSQLTGSPLQFGSSLAGAAPQVIHNGSTWLRR